MVKASRKKFWWTLRHDVDGLRDELGFVTEMLVVETGQALTLKVDWVLGFRFLWLW